MASNQKGVLDANPSSGDTHTLVMTDGGSRSAPIHSKIQNFIDKIAALGGGIVTLQGPPGVYWIGAQIKTPATIGIVSHPGIIFRCTTANAGRFDAVDGQGNSVYKDHYARFPGGYMFTHNIAYNPDGTFSSSIWKLAYPGIRGTVFENIVIEQDPNDWNVPVHFLYTSAPAKISNIRTLYAHDLVVVPSVYMDGLNLKRVDSYYSWTDTNITNDRNPDRTRGRIVISNLGDDIVIESCCGSIQLMNNRGCTIIGSFASIFLTNCTAVNIMGRHNESSSEFIETDNSSLIVSGSHYWQNTKAKIRIKNNSHLSIKNCDFEFIYNSGASWMVSPGCDIAIDDSSTLNVEKCFRVATPNGNIGEKHRTGIIVGQWNTTTDAITEFMDWTYYSHLLSKEGSISSGLRINLNHSIDSIPNISQMGSEGIYVMDLTQTIYDSTLNPNAPPWSKASQGTATVQYFYRVMYAIDWPRRFFHRMGIQGGNLAGQTSTNRTNQNGAAPTANATSTSTRLVLYPVANIYSGTPSKGYYPRLAIVLRVPATGQTLDANTVYSDIAYIPIPEHTQALHLFDIGDCISGYAWQTWNQARPTDYMVNAASWGAGRFKGVIPYNQARPTNTAGTNSIQGYPGDVLELDPPTAGYPLKYVRTADNTVANMQWQADSFVPIFAYSAVTPTAIANGSQFISGAITATGAVIGDKVEVFYDQPLSNCVLSAQITATDQVKAFFTNTSGATQTPAAGNLTFKITKIK
jgi:hypothetical protein